MHKIRDWLFIGKYRETVSRPLLNSYNIGAMLHLADDVQHDGIETLYLPIDDGVPIKQDVLKQGINFIIDQKSQDKIVLSACGAGISRSTTFAMGALMHVEDLDIWEAYKSILAVHPDAFPMPALVMSLGTYFDEAISEYDAARTTMDMSVARKRQRLM